MGFFKKDIFEIAEILIGIYILIYLSGLVLAWIIGFIPSFSHIEGKPIVTAYNDLMASMAGIASVLFIYVVISLYYLADLLWGIKYGGKTNRFYKIAWFAVIFFFAFGYFPVETMQYTIMELPVIKENVPAWTPWVLVFMAAYPLLRFIYWYVDGEGSENSHESKVSKKG